MKNKILLFFLVFATSQVFCQNANLALNSIKNSELILKQESIATARYQAILSLKRTLNQQILLNGIDNLLDKGEISTDIFNQYLSELDKTHLQKIQVLNQENKPFQENYIDKSIANRFNSKIKSLACLLKTNNKDFVRTKDDEGEEVVAFPLENLKSNTRYGLVDAYHQGFARIKKDQVYGFVNLCGEEIIPAQFEYAEPFNDGKALVKKFIWYFIDIEGNESDELDGIVDAKALNYGISLVKLKNNKFTLINNEFDKTKKPICQLYDQIEPFNVGENLFKVRNGKLYGLIRINGVQVLDVVYDRVIQSEMEQYILVEKAKKVGLVSLEGAVKINTVFDEIAGVITNQTVSKSAIPVIVKDQIGFKVMELTTDKASSTYSIINNFNAFGLAKACKEVNGKLKCGYINYEGVEVIPTQFDEIFDFTRFGLVVARNKFENCAIQNSPCQADIIFDKSGNIIRDKTSATNPISIKYIVTDTLFNKSLIIVKTTYASELSPINEGFHLLDKSNNTLITTVPYSQIKRFNDELILVMNDNKWGVLDYSGKIVIKTQYKEILNESEGMFGVKVDNNKLGYVDRKGKVQITFEYSEIQAFKNGLAIVAKNSKFGIITKFNAKIAPCVFKEINPIPGGNFELVDNSSTKYILNSNGDCQTNCAKFDDIRKKANN